MDLNYPDFSLVLSIPESGPYLVQDKKPVYLLDTYHRPSETGVIHRYTGGPVRTDHDVPKTLEVYNKYRCGVDVLDSIQSYYRVGRRSRRAWPNKHWWFFDRAIINAHRLFEIKISKQIHHLDFRNQLMYQLAGMNFPSHGRKRGPAPPASVPENQGHWPVLQDKSSRCHYCYNHNNPGKSSKYKCVDCDKYLCVDPCFRMYHSLNHSE